MPDDATEMMSIEFSGDIADNSVTVSEESHSNVPATAYLNNPEEFEKTQKLDIEAENVVNQLDLFKIVGSVAGSIDNTTAADESSLQSTQVQGFQNNMELSTGTNNNVDGLKSIDSIGQTRSAVPISLSCRSPPPSHGCAGSKINHRGGVHDRCSSIKSPNQQDGLHPSFASPSLNKIDASFDQRWRNPDLSEVVDYLTHPSDSVKANAAAYLQHLCYKDDLVKVRVRELNGIELLVKLLDHPSPDVHQSACGALRNLSYGRTNDLNKDEIKNVLGIPALVRLLESSQDSNVQDLVTGILWNLSSCPNLKKLIIDDGLTTIVDTVFIPMSLTDSTRIKQPSDIKAYPTSAGTGWSPIFRNASGIIRNVSSDGEYARKKLRECVGLIESIVSIVSSAIGRNQMDNKCVENCVCILRNLSYACQEVEDVNYLKKKNSQQNSSQGSSTGCFGKKSKKDGKMRDQQAPTTPLSMTTSASSLWHPDIIHMYLPLMAECTNPDTLEAAAGAIQNLCACDWPPSAEIRLAVRREKGLPVIVDLLTLDSDKVVCAAATALRNLAIDINNKELIGKYAIQHLLKKLPSVRPNTAFSFSDNTVAAVEATLYEIIKTNITFVKSVLVSGGVDQLMNIVKSPPNKYSDRVMVFASQILQKMWSFSELHEDYKKMGWKMNDFQTKPAGVKSSHSSQSVSDSTLTRPHMGQSGPSMAGCNENTARINRQSKFDNLYDSSIPPSPFNIPNGSHNNSLSRHLSTDIPMSYLRSPASPGQNNQHFTYQGKQTGMVSFESFPRNGSNEKSLRKNREHLSNERSSCSPPKGTNPDIRDRDPICRPGLAFEEPDPQNRPNFSDPRTNVSQHPDKRKPHFDQLEDIPGVDSWV